MERVSNKIESCMHFGIITLSLNEMKEEFFCERL